MAGFLSSGGRSTSAFGLFLALALFLSHGLPEVEADHNCAAAGSPRGRFDLLTYEAKDWQKVYGDSLTQAGFNFLFPEDSYFGLPPIEQGPRSNRAIAPQRYIPPVILKAIAWIESSWTQAERSVPYGGIGRVLLSHSCAYGIVQVLSGMENKTGMPTEQQAMVGAHYAYNIARGAAILAEKWNAAPTFRPIVGDGDPKVLEDWYYAIWSYHGFTIRNHPLNPDYDLLRAPFACDGAQSYLDYPYQELIYGCMKNPPRPVVDGERRPLWSPQPATLPDLNSEVIFKAMSINNFLFNAEKMDIPRPEPNHSDPTPATGDRATLIGLPQIVVPTREVNFELINDDPQSSTGTTTVEIKNGGSGPMVWLARPSEVWIELSRFQGIALGSELGGAQTNLTINVRAGVMEPGRYEGTVAIVSPTIGPDAAIITVRLTVSERSYVPGVTKD